MSDEDFGTRLRKIRNFVEATKHIDTPSHSTSEFMAVNANNNQTLKELAAPDLNQQPLCIEFPNLDVAFELKSGLIHLLPTFLGLAGEDPHKHLKKFHVVCLSMKPAGIHEE